MPASHTEKALEDVIEEALLKRGWTKGSPADFDRVRAICPNDFLKFIEATQPKLVNELKQQHGAAFEAGIIDALAKHLDSQGSLDALRRGIKFYGKKLQCAYFKPSHGMNYDVLAQYAQNRLVVTRQVHFAPENHPDEPQSVDLMLSVNGIPVAT